MEKEFADMIQVEKLAWTIDHLANQSNSLQLLIRYEGSLNRSYERAYKQLQQLQKDYPPQQNEPEPAPLAILPAPKNKPEPHPEPPPEAEKCETNPTEPPVGDSDPPPEPKTAPEEQKEA